MGTRQRVIGDDRLVGQRAREIRTIEGRSQESVVTAMRGRGFQWHQTTISRIERGEQPLTLAEAAALADIYGQPVTVFLGDRYSPALPSVPELLDTLARVASEIRAAHEDAA